MKFATIALVFLGALTVQGASIESAIKAEAGQPCVYLDETQKELSY
jgi:hypothetical protein